jgi:hypothetical protein
MAPRRPVNRTAHTDDHATCSAVHNLWTDGARSAGTGPIRTPTDRTDTLRPISPGARRYELAARSVGMIDDVTATTPTAPAPAPAPRAPAVADRAVRRAQARDLTSGAAARWLTPEATTQLGRAITLSITRYARDHRQQPTWADALNAVDPTLCEPMTTAPADWPLPAAVWRREVRLRLMGQLKRTRWITYTATPRSLHIGPEGRAWLTTTGKPPD